MTITLGAGTVVVMGNAGPAFGALWLVSLCGVCVWLTPLLHSRQAKHVPSTIDKGLIILRLLVAVVVAIVLAIISGGAGFLWLAIGAVVLMAVVYISCRWSKLWLVWGVGVVALGLYLITSGVLPGFRGVLGLGERSFAFVSGRDSGLAILGATTGLGGVLFFTGGIIGLAIWAMIRTHKSSPDQLGRAAVWVLAALLSAAALLGPGGYVTSATAIAFIFTWGLLPRMTNMPSKFRPGWIILIAIVAIMVIINISERTGMVGWMATSHHMNDKAIHRAAGFILGVVLAWWLGSRRWWAGLLGLLLAVIAGGMGEFVQKLFSNRGVELADWKMHCCGVGAAAILYLLLVGYRYLQHRLPKMMSLRRKTRQLYLPVSLSLALCVLIVVPAIIWSFRVSVFMANRWQQPLPRFVVADAVASTQKSPFFIPGTTNVKYSGWVPTLFSVSSVTHRPEPALPGHKRGYVRVCPKVSYLIAGLNQIQVNGIPFGPFCLSDSQDVLVAGVSTGDNIYCLDTRDVEKWLKEKPVKFRSLIEKLRQKGTVAFILPGTVAEYEPYRGKFQSLFPAIPNVCDVTFYAGEIRTFYCLKTSILIGNPKPTVFLITTRQASALTARRYLGKTLIVYLIGNQTGKSSQYKWLKHYKTLWGCPIFMESTRR
ncbi:MAG: VanZ family protein [Phycisphaerae bacterium]|nr:VanZ family protein [Phycisphaerae bacterium]